MEDRIPKETWTAEMYKARIVTVDKDIVLYQQRIDKIHSEIAVLKQEKIKLQGWISKKAKYKYLLIKHIFDLIPVIEDVQQVDKNFCTAPNDEQEPDEYDKRVKNTIENKASQPGWMEKFTAMATKRYRFMNNEDLNYLIKWIEGNVPKEGSDLSSQPHKDGEE